MIKTYATTGTHDRGKSAPSIVSGPKDNEVSRQLITNTSTHNHNHKLCKRKQEHDKESSQYQPWHQRQWSQQAREDTGRQ